MMIFIIVHSFLSSIKINAYNMHLNKGQTVRNKMRKNAKLCRYRMKKNYSDTKAQTNIFGCIDLWYGKLVGFIETHERDYTESQLCMKIF